MERTTLYPEKISRNKNEQMVIMELERKGWRVAKWKPNGQYSSIFTLEVTISEVMIKFLAHQYKLRQCRRPRWKIFLWKIFSKLSFQQ